MSRPKYTEKDTKAKEKIIECFWDLIADEKQSRLSVIEICRRAEVNKNTFYYYFDSIEDLSEQEMKSTLNLALAGEMLKNALFMDGEEHMELPQNCQNDDFYKICILAASGQSFIVEQLKESMRRIWCQVCGTSYALLSEGEADSLEFVLGGILSILQNCAKRKRTETYEILKICKRPFMKSVIYDFHRTIKGVSGNGSD